MSEVGPERIVEVASGAHYCTDCRADILGEGHETSMAVVARVPDGVCSCCEVVIDAGAFD